MTPEQNITLVQRYFAACQTGVIAELKATLHPEVVHYFLPKEHAPVRGAEHLARYWSKFHRLCRPVWQLDKTMAAGDDVVSEWSCRYWTKDGSRQSVFRGTEWYVIREGLIAEVRAYYSYEEGQRCELNGFPYDSRPEYLTASGASSRH